MGRVFLLAVVLVTSQLTGVGYGRDESTAVADQEALWTSLEAVSEDFFELRPESEDQEVVDRFLLEACHKAGSIADRYREFMEQYSESEHADEAWDRWMEFLSIAASHVETRRTELVRAEEKWLSDPKVTKTQREIIRGNQIERTADPIQCEQMVRQFMHETHSPDTFFCWHMLQIAGSADSMQARRLVDEVLKKTAEVRGLSSVRDRALLLSRNLERVGKRFDLSFQSLQGNAIELSAYRGKVVLVHFWATWCPPCIAKLPELKTLRQTHGAKGFEIVSITYDTDREKLARFVENHDIEWPQFFDPRGMECDLVQRLGAPGPPAYWLIDQDGMLIEIGAGPKLDRLITEQLNRDSRR